MTTRCFVLVGSMGFGGGPAARGNASRLLRTGSLFVKPALSPHNVHKSFCANAAQPLTRYSSLCLPKLPPLTPPPLPRLPCPTKSLENSHGEHLLLLRAKPPNFGIWSPIGGKLETALGESPFECAVRETREETGFEIAVSDLHLFAMIAEKAYEGETHWLMFLFRCKRPISALPDAISEGRFGFFNREAIDSLPVPETDRQALWPIYDRYREGFVALRADCAPGEPIRVEVEQITGAA